MNNKKTKRVASTVAACALVAALGLGSTLAYLTDAEVAKNTFTVGDVKIELLEPNYPGNDSDEVKDIVPNEEIDKDPSVVNRGVNDTVIFMTVDSPMEYVTLVKDDGSAVNKYQLTETMQYTKPDGTTGEEEVVNQYPQARVQEIFWFKDKADEASTHANNFDSNWTELTAKEYYVVIDRAGNEHIIALGDQDVVGDDEVDGLEDASWGTQDGKTPLLGQVGNSEADKLYNKISTRQEALQAIYQNLPSDSRLVKRYVFAYKVDTQGSTTHDEDAVKAAAKLGDAADERSTTALFDKVQLKNFIENEIDKTTQTIEIRAYAIQDSELLENSVDLGDELNVENMNHIYEMFVAQNSSNTPSGDVKVINLRDADSVAKTHEGEYERQTDGSYSDPTVDHTNRWDGTENVSGAGQNLKPVDDTSGGPNPDPVGP